MNHTKIAREAINRVYFSRTKRNEVKRKWTKKMKTCHKPKVDIRLNKRVIRQVRECSNYDSFSSITSDDVLDNLYTSVSTASRGRDPSIHP